MLIDVSLRDGQTVAIDFSVVSPAAESYCKQSAKEPLHAAALREATKIFKYARAYKEFSAFSNVMAARVTKSLDFQKYAMADPLYLSR